MWNTIATVVSLVISVSALLVGVWNVQRSRALSLNSGSQAVVAEIFREYRSDEFRLHSRNVADLAQDHSGVDQFESLPEEIRDSAYQVCYFMDYVGALVAFRLIREEVVLAPMCSQIIRYWNILKPYIVAERKHRESDYPKPASPRFLNYFEHIAARIEVSGGKFYSDRINSRIGLIKMSDSDGSARLDSAKN